jgi:hypothetical protein
MGRALVSCLCILTEVRIWRLNFFFRFLIVVIMVDILGRLFLTFFICLFLGLFFAFLAPCLRRRGGKDGMGCDGHSTAQGAWVTWLIVYGKRWP